MAVYTTVNDPSAYFHTQLYTGDGNATQAITNDANAGNFKPDWVWLKRRTAAESYMLADSNRGVVKRIRSDGNNVEGNNGLTSFNTDGFTTLSNAVWNTNNENYVAWQWKANGGTNASNSSGSVTSTVQANTTAGFSIVTYTATGSGDITVGHGLGAAPEVILTKTRSVAYDWRVFISFPNVGGAGKALQLDGTGSLSTNNSYPSPAPTSTVMTMGRGNDDNNNYANGQTLVSYCFRSIQGYSKFGVYTGNGNANGPFVYTGFKPAFLMIKRTDASNDWWIIDDKRDDYQNPFSDLLEANTSGAENANTPRGDFLSNGFKWRVSPNAFNASNGTYLYMAFAANPFVTSDGVPTTAR